MSRSPELPIQEQYKEKEERQIIFEQELPEWKVSGVFSSHMVLQRDVPITIWGWSKHIGAYVCATWTDEKVTSYVNREGRFEITFSPRTVSFEPSDIRIESDYGSDVLSDVLVGDVWVIGGQSNAELALEPCLMLTREIAEELNAHKPIRLFAQKGLVARENAQFYMHPARDIICEEWGWKRACAEQAKEFSALGYYFAHLLIEKVDVPIGLIMMCAGGACLRELMPVELAHKLGYYKGANVPVGGYYNTLIAPLIGILFKGQIFFQGESEGIWREMALSYDKDLAAYVADERERFGFDFPFYNVQLSSYRTECNSYFPHLYWVRSRQLRALDKIPNSYLAVSRDLGSLSGEADFAHSIHKYELAKRVVSLALAGEYGIGDISNAYSPMPVRAVRNGDTVEVCFQYVKGGLVTIDRKPIVGFSFMNEDGMMISAKAKIISSDTVEIVIPEGVKTEEIYFAMNNMAYMEQANLCDDMNLPIPAFAMRVARG